MSSKFEMRLRAIEHALARLPESCPCEHHTEQVRECVGCRDAVARAEGFAIVANMRRALDADARFNR